MSTAADRAALARAASRIAARVASAQERLDELRDARAVHMRTMLDAGMSTAEIARSFAVSRSFVGRVLDHPHGTPGRPRKAALDG